ncbi:MAG TPA: glycoside hydrolase family 1 protein [Candidatus Saccharimonadales bacterium]
MPEDTKRSFPKDFLWGASTSAHQVEGGNHNQWTVWELENATRLAKNAEKLHHWRWQSPIWDEVKNQAKSPANYASGRGVEHYKLYKQDFELLKKLNLNSFRFSIEWSRIEPEEGRWNQEAIDHYIQYIAELKKQGIEPMLNIWHWTNPIWFEARGGFKYRKNLKYFKRFVHKVAKELTRDIKYIITINEPNVYVTYSYMLGLWPPQEKSTLSLLRVYFNLVAAHREAYYILKLQKPSLKIGVAAQLANIQAKDPHSMSDELSTKIMRLVWNWWFLHRIRDEQDFVGINYYFTDYYDGWFKRKNPSTPVSDRGWYMEPEGLYPLLLRAWAHYHKPIIVTENGVADMHDQYRRWWIEETIVAMERAISEGVKIKGYFHWSLLDNFEWEEGWWPKFGLVEVKRHHGMKRVIRPSAKWFATKIKRLSGGE